MTGISADGWLEGVERLASPNADERPPGTDIDLLVIHNISLPPGVFGGRAIHDFFTNRLDGGADPFFARIAHLRVSAHLLIERDGAVTQFVPFTRRAWHAGQSVFQRRERCNDFAVGIELEGTDITPYTDAQYERLTAVTAALQRAYPGIAPSRIVGHCDIAPGRKTDPGTAFDWYRYLSGLC